MKFHAPTLSAIVLIAVAVSGCSQSSNELRQPYGQVPADEHPPVAGYGVVPPDYPDAAGRVAPTSGNGTYFGPAAPVTPSTGTR